MTEREFEIEWCRLSERYMGALDNPRQLRIIRKALDKLWVTLDRGK
jgi:hypothetical protein